MAWNASLNLNYSLRESSDSSKTVAHFNHTGPLRILQSLYPEGDSICHNVLVHPPGGLVGGDTLDININVASGAHALVTTPGATRFYRSDGEQALQRSCITLQDNARMEWLPLEAICYSGCLAENRLTMKLAPGAELLGWDVTAFGLPAASKPFDTGHFCQHIEVPGVWLERAQIRALDTLLMNSPLGLAGHRCMGTLFFVAGSKLAPTLCVPLQARPALTGRWWWCGFWPRWWSLPWHCSDRSGWHGAVISGNRRHPAHASGSPDQGLGGGAAGIGPVLR